MIARWLGVIVVLASASNVAGAGASRGAAPASPALSQAETNYADWLDAVSALATIESGLVTKVDHRSHAAWTRRLRELTMALDASLAAAQADDLGAEGSRALDAMRKGRADSAPENAGTDPLRPPVHCSASGGPADAASLQLALYACFDEIGDNIQFAGQRIVRTTALQRLQQIDDPAARRQLFLALSPLWTVINGNDTPDSPYRRMMAEASKNSAATDAVSKAAATLGIDPKEAERWLILVLEAWQAQSRGPALEPWDYWYASASASRALSPAIPRSAVLPISKRFYRDLGADLDALGVVHDLDVRPGKAPLAYTDQMRIGRMTAHGWRKTLPRVSANYEEGGLFVLNELIHEDGHAVHEAALRVRPAYYSLGDDLFVEAFADVTAWSSSEPSWQKRYLGTAAAEAASMRELYSNVVLDAAWSLFELRMLGNPAADPNLVWTDITARYLNIVPHPELSWWALRVQLVRWPGYMLNYGLGAVLTADIRARIKQSIGGFDEGNPRWYPWLSEQLLRFGATLETPQLLQQFLGRPISPQAILGEIARVGSPADSPASSAVSSVDGLDRENLRKAALQ